MAENQPDIHGTFHHPAFPTVSSAQAARQLHDQRAAFALAAIAEAVAATPPFQPKSLQQVVFRAVEARIFEGAPILTGKEYLSAKSMQK